MVPCNSSRWVFHCLANTQQVIVVHMSVFYSWTKFAGFFPGISSPWHLCMTKCNFDYLIPNFVSITSHIWLTSQTLKPFCQSITINHRYTIQIILKKDWNDLANVIVQHFSCLLIVQTQTFISKNLFNKPLNLVNHCTARLATVSALSKTIIVSGNLSRSFVMLWYS